MHFQYYKHWFNCWFAALLLHPDKNKHPKAEFAFKLVSQVWFWIHYTKINDITQSQNQMFYVLTLCCRHTHVSQMKQKDLSLMSKDRKIAAGNVPKRNNVEPMGKGHHHLQIDQDLRRYPQDWKKLKQDLWKKQEW